VLLNHAWGGTGRVKMFTLSTIQCNLALCANNSFLADGTDNFNTGGLAGEPTGGSY